MADKLPSTSFHFVLHGEGHRFSVSGGREAYNLDHFSIVFISLLDHVLANAPYRDHGIAEIPLDRRLRSVQPRSVTLPGWIGEAEGVAFKLQGYDERILGSVHTLRELPGTRNCMGSTRSFGYPTQNVLPRDHITVGATTLRPLERGGAPVG